jgi:hypothetical protein
VLVENLAAEDEEEDVRIAPLDAGSQGGGASTASGAGGAPDE